MAPVGPTWNGRLISRIVNTRVTAFPNRSAMARGVPLVISRNGHASVA